MHLPIVDNFWHGQATVMLTERLPLYILFVYPGFLYVPLACVWRLVVQTQMLTTVFRVSGSDAMAEAEALPPVRAMRRAGGRAASASRMRVAYSRR